LKSPHDSPINENHQKKYPILRLDLKEPSVRHQCAFRMKAKAKIQADTRCTLRDPHHTIHTEPRTKSIVVAALPVGSILHPQQTESFLLTPSYGHTADAAIRKACQPGRPFGNVTSPSTTGRNQAVTCSSQAAPITQCAFLADMRASFVVRCYCAVTAHTFRRAMPCTTLTINRPFPQAISA
jgi:hypothetical protein